MMSGLWSHETIVDDILQRIKNCFENEHHYKEVIRQESVIEKFYVTPQPWKGVIIKKKKSSLDS